MEPKTAKIPFVPENCYLHYLAEGAANIVYRISVRPPTPDPSILEEYSGTTPPPTIIETDDGEEVDLAIFDAKLLRVRKDVPTTIPVAVAQEQYVRLIVPLFDKEDLVQQELVKLGPMDIVEKLNIELNKLELDSAKDMKRPARREGIYLAEDKFGLLVTDMSANYLREVIEFKPKWLSQSPSAPKDSVRCRNCAVTARRNQERHTANPPEKLLEGFCPLDLVSRSTDDVLYVASVLLRPKTNFASVERLAKWIYNNSLLVRLRDAQVYLDKKGPMKANPSNEDYRVAMTLRDCTLYIRLPNNKEDDETGIEARLGDLDVKSAAKGPYWKETERQLINEGWYNGNERWTTPEQQEITCALGRKFRTRDRI
ncbi:uncharacterized protein LY89DRAFT_743147 [Mollisia scopiformis]|uniref:Inositol-pentakisphosphate 2-kinase n=1 Tax=Mollisia scopiformis TaxID=149040 RepID=A0A132B486_MOLSC|nr:uncharacterized protein LY89DRAFT_743147 [Mollisia scopiformis]KUJ07151.1 hypothetical protein LY89DRAFT_743147 [Mollisia scopiformis]